MKHAGFYVFLSSKHLQCLFTIHPINNGEIIGIFSRAVKQLQFRLQNQVEELKINSVNQ